MSIFGIGTDLVAIDRIKKLFNNHEQAFCERILSKTEQLEITEVNDKVAFLAKRFAAKEAIAKALGVGIGQVISFQDITIAHDSKGKPLVHLADQDNINNYLLENGIAKIMLSIADEKQYAQAFAIAVI